MEPAILSFLLHQTSSKVGSDIPTIIGEIISIPSSRWKGQNETSRFQIIFVSVTIKKYIEGPGNAIERREKWKINSIDGLLEVMWVTSSLVYINFCSYGEPFAITSSYIGAYNTILMNIIDLFHKNKYCWKYDMDE